jgi:glutamine transport system ATP-binding protein
MSTRVKVSNVSKNFGNVVALNNVSCEVKQGDVFFIIGSSGSGKSTLLRCINRLENVTSGDIWIENDLVTGRRLISGRSGKRPEWFSSHSIFSLI